MWQVRGDTCSSKERALPRDGGDSGSKRRTPNQEFFARHKLDIERHKGCTQEGCWDYLYATFGGNERALVLVVDLGKTFLS